MGFCRGGCGLDVVGFFLPLHPSQIFPLLLCRSSMAAVLLGIPTLCMEHFLLSFFSCAQPAGLFLSPFFHIPHCLCGVFCPFLHTSSQGPTSLAGGLSCTLWWVVGAAGTDCVLTEAPYSPCWQCLGTCTQYLVILKLSMRVSSLHFVWGHWDAGFNMNELLLHF